MQPDFDDLRFTDNDGVTLLNYWIESKIDGVSATVWVKVPSIPASADENHLHVLRQPERGERRERGRDV